MKYKVLITDHVWPSVEPERAVLARADADIVVAPDGSEETLTELARDVHGILTCFALVTERVVREAENLQVVGRFGVGVDNIAVDVATELGIAVTYVPDYCVDEVSSHAMALLLAWNRRITLFNQAVKSEGWESLKLGMPMPRLRGKKLGVIGFGRIGRSTCAKARAFGMEVLAYSPSLTEDDATAHGARLASLPELLEQSDYVSIHTPLTPQTEGMIGARELASMKPGAVIINTARGAVIDETALHDALVAGQIAGAGLDVAAQTPPPQHHPLFELDNVIVTPHIAFFSQEAVLELEERGAGEVASVLLGRMPDNLYNTSVLTHPSPRHRLPRA